MFCRGRILVFYICYNLFFAGGEQFFVITCSLQGEIYAHNLSSSKRGRILDFDFDDKICDVDALELYLKSL